MSDNFLRLIPTQPEYTPTKLAGQKAQDFFQTLVAPNCMVMTRVTEEIEFIDAGGNCESISCPNCGSAIPDSWWTLTMRQAYQSHFSDLNAVTPCCQSKTSLNDLTYNWPQGFARFILEAQNPGILALEPKAISALEKILACKLRVIWAHY